MRRGTGLALIAVCLLAATGSIGLGFWQLGRLQARRAANRIVIAGRTLPQLSLNSTAARDSLSQRRAFATGVFDYAHASSCADEIERDAPGVHLVVPLRPLGTERSGARASRLRARERRVPSRYQHVRYHPGRAYRRGDPAPVPDDPAGRRRRSASGATPPGSGSTAPRCGARLPYPVLDVYLFETTKEPRPDPARPWPILATLPRWTTDRILSYMVQWFGIAAAALAFGIIFGRRSGLAIWRFRGSGEDSDSLIRLRSLAATPIS